MSPDSPPAVRTRRERRRAEARSTRGLRLAAAVVVGVLVVLVVVVCHGEGTPTVAAAPSVVLAPAAASHGPASHDAIPHAQSEARRTPASAEIADAGFVADVDARSVSYDSRDDVVAAGRNVCAFLRRGGTEAGARLLALPYRQYSPADAAAIAHAAVGAYCPDRGGPPAR